MLNKSIKEKFIQKRRSEASLDKGFLERIFKKAEPFEEELGKDLSCFTRAEIEEMYKVWGYSAVETLANINSQLIQYTYYCIEHNIVFDGQNHYYEIDVDVLMNCVNWLYKDGTIVTRKKIYSILDELDNDIDCFMLLAFYEGFGGENHCEVSCARLSDFDIEAGIFHSCLGREIRITRKLYEYAVKANEQTIYYSIGSGKKTRLMNDGYIYKLGKTRDGEADELYRKGRSIYIRMTKIINTYFDNPKTTIRDIRTSGKTDYLVNISVKRNISPFAAIQDDFIIRKIDRQYNDHTIKSMYLKKYSNAIKRLYEEKLGIENQV